jgi:hypothetical protein
MRLKEMVRLSWSSGNPSVYRALVLGEAVGEVRPWEVGGSIAVAEVAVEGGIELAAVPQTALA